jgi:hypothetical protein
MWMRVSSTTETLGAGDSARERELLHIVDSAQVRIEIGLCKRDDYRDIFVEAKVEPKTSKRINRLPGAPHHG